MPRAAQHDPEELSIAKRKKRRPAGPPPAKSPRMERLAATPSSSSRPGRPERPSRRHGEPRRPELKNLFVRAGMIAAAYYLMLVLLFHQKPVYAFAIALIGFVIMLPLGYWMDRVRYRSQLKRFEAKRAGGGR